MSKTPLKLIYMEDIISVPVKWLWKPYIPSGKLTLMHGDPGSGKTTVAAKVAAAVTRGEMLPGEAEPREPANVIFQTAEDGLADTIKPRLEAAGADCNRILVIDESKECLSMTDDRLEEAIRLTNAKLVILDPIQAYIGANVDMHRANEIRPVMSRLGRIAEEYDCAVILIGHMNKATGQKCTYRGLGSIDITAVARSVLVVGEMRDDKSKRVICHSKSSLAPTGKTILFSITENSMLEWLGTVEVTADEFLEDGGAKIGKLESAKNFLNTFLSDGAKPQKEVMEAAESLNFGDRTLKTAKSVLGIKSVRVNDEWLWKLSK